VEGLSRKAPALRSHELRGDTLNLAAGALLHGRFPYDQRTYLGNLITPMPGAVLLATPFVLLGSSAWQNLFWLPALYLAARRLLADPRLALLLWWSVLGLSPVVLQELVSGGDLLSNALYVPLLVLWTARAAPRPDLPPWRRMAPPVLLGVALSSRANYLLVLPLLVSMLVQHAGRRVAMRATVLVLGAFALVTLPFFLYDPQHFAPLITTRRLEFVRGLPAPRLVITVGAALLALALAARRMDAPGVRLLAGCAAVQAWPVLAAWLALAGAGAPRPTAPNQVPTPEGLTVAYSSRVWALVDAAYDRSRFNSLPRAFG